MIGTRIESAPALPKLFVISLVGWIALMGTAIWTMNVNIAIGSIPLFLATFLSLWNREKQVVFEVEQNGLYFGDTEDLVEYESIQFLNPVPSNSTHKQFDIELVHSGGSLTIPRTISQSSNSLFQFLKSRQPEKSKGFVHPVLVDYLLEQQKQFGEEKVFLFCPRANRQTASYAKEARLIGLCFLLTATFWSIAAAFSFDWKIEAVFSAVVGGIFFLVSFSTSDPVKRQIKNWKESTLIVSPAGIALVQGDLKGKLRWDEVRSVKKTYAGGLSIRRELPGLQIQVSGSQFVIVNIYDETLDTIRDRITAYYSGNLSPQTSSRTL